MKTIFHFPTLLFFCMISFIAGCGSTSGGRTNISTTISEGMVRFNLNGTDWISSGDHPDSEFEVDAITDHSTVIHVEAFGADGSHFSLIILRKSGISTGTYAFSNSHIQGFYETRFGKGEIYLTNAIPDNPGSVTISTLTDKKVSGTFHYPLRNAANPDDRLEFTNGKFDVTFTKL